MIGNHILYLSYSLLLPYKTILLEVSLPCMWINLTLLTIYTFNGRTINKGLPQSYMPLTHFKTILRKILESRDLFISGYMSTISLATS